MAAIKNGKVIVYGFYKYFMLYICGYKSVKAGGNSLINIITARARANKQAPYLAVSYISYRKAELAFYMLCKLIGGGFYICASEYKAIRGNIFFNAVKFQSLAKAIINSAPAHIKICVHRNNGNLVV